MSNSQKDNRYQERYQFFMFKDKSYGVGTVVKFTEHYREKQRAKYHYAEISDANFLKGWIVVSILDREYYEVSGYVLHTDELDAIIEEIVTPVEVPYVDPKDKKYAYSDFEIHGMIEAWIIYLFFMAVSTIFKGRIFFWILYSIIFFGWRHAEKDSFGYK